MIASIIRHSVAHNDMHDLTSIGTSRRDRGEAQTLEQTLLTDAISRHVYRILRRLTLGILLVC